MTAARLPLASLILAIFLAGCAGAHKTPDFNVIRLYNDSPSDISDVELSAGGSITALGHLPAGHSPTSDRGVKPDPATAQVSWRTADGQHIERDVAIAKKIPPKFHGVIVLLLKEGGDVTMEFVPYTDLK